MKFPCQFLRFKTTATAGSGATIAIGADVIPTDGANNQVRGSSQTNLITFPAFSRSGFPNQRVMLVSKFIGAANPIVALNVAAYVFEDYIGCWIQVSQNVTTITPGGGNSPAFGATGVPTYFDVPTVGDLSHINADLGAGQSGSIQMIFLITDPGTALAGTYLFSAAPILNTNAKTF
jgi:hypothetical protein